MPISICLYAALMQEIDELFKIFRLLGTPNEQTWPGVSQLADFSSTFPQWDRVPWRVMCFPHVQAHVIKSFSMPMYDIACKRACT